MVTYSGYNSIKGLTKISSKASNAIPGYDIFLIAGQSNCFAGLEESGDVFPDVTYDATDPDILQWGRYSPNDGVVITAEEPLDHHTQRTDAVGWAMTFAKIYKAKKHLAANRDVLLIPCAFGGSSFNSNHWNKGDTYYEDAKNRTLAALAADSGNVLKGMLWMQGESDADNSTEAGQYETKFSTFIDNIRTDLSDANLPVVAGGMVPDWVSEQTYRGTVQTAIQAVVAAKSYMAYADPTDPTTLLGSTIVGESVHYQGRSMRGVTPDPTDASTCGFAGRFYEAWLDASINA